MVLAGLFTEDLSIGTMLVINIYPISRLSSLLAQWSAIIFCVLWYWSWWLVLSLLCQFSEAWQLENRKNKFLNKSFPNAHNSSNEPNQLITRKGRLNVTAGSANLLAFMLYYGGLLATHSYWSSKICFPFNRSMLHTVTWIFCFLDRKCTLMTSLEYITSKSFSA